MADSSNEEFVVSGAKVYCTGSADPQKRVAFLSKDRGVYVGNNFIGTEIDISPEENFNSNFGICKFTQKECHLSPLSKWFYTSDSVMYNCRRERLSHYKANVETAYQLAVEYFSICDNDFAFTTMSEGNIWPTGESEADTEKKQRDSIREYMQKHYFCDQLMSEFLNANSDYYTLLSDNADDCHLIQYRLTTLLQTLEIYHINAPSEGKSKESEKKYEKVEKAVNQLVLDMEEFFTPPKNERLLLKKSVLVCFMKGIIHFEDCGQKDINIVGAVAINKSLRDGGLYLSADKQDMIYNGEYYPVFVPPQGVASIDSPNWVKVYSKSFGKTEFDFFKAFLGVSIESPRDDKAIYVGNRKDTNGGQPMLSALPNSKYNKKASRDAQMLGFVIAGISVLNAFSDGIEATKVTVYLYKNGEQKRSIITVGSSETQKYFQNFEYGYVHTSFFDYAGKPGAQIGAIKGGRALYSLFTGVKTSEDYSLGYTWDKNHMSCNFSAYLSFNSSGDLMQTFHSFPEDRIYISKLSGFMNMNVTHEIDITSIMYPSFSAPELYGELLRKCFDVI